jgi:hypothetical protein
MRRLPMLSADRAEFDRLLATLCAGWDKPVTDSRAAAYWQGLAKMNLVDFGRVVEHCLGEGAPEKFPTVRDCWGLAKMLRPVRSLGALAKAAPDELWLMRANLKLLAHFRALNAATPWRYGGKTETFDVMRARLQPLIEAKDTWALDMRESESSRNDPAYQERLWNELIVVATNRIDAMIAGHLELA